MQLVLHLLFQSIIASYQTVPAHLIDAPRDLRVLKELPARLEVYCRSIYHSMISIFSEAGLPGKDGSKGAPGVNVLIKSSRPGCIVCPMGPPGPPVSLIFLKSD